MEINKRVESMRDVDYSELRFPMITIYERPKDFPGEYVARVWDGAGPKATNIIKTAPAAGILREDIKAAGFTICFPRAEGDDECIVETWIR